MNERHQEPDLGMNPPRASPRTANLVVAGSLGAFVIGTYWYTTRSVGQDDLAKEIDCEVAKMAKEDQAQK